MTKLGRNYKVTVQVDDDGSTLEVKYPLTIDFHVRREILSSAGTGTFMMYNLNEKNRNRIFKPLTDLGIVRSIKMEAGYGNNLNTIFDGFIREAKSFRQTGTTNIITQAEGYDYAPGMPDKVSNWSTQEPSNTKEYCIRRIITQDLKASIGAIGSFPGIYARNPAFCEPAWEALKKVTDGKCFFDNGKVFCLNDNDVFEGSVPVIDSSVGLLGSPRINGTWVIFDMIFEPRLRNGQEIRLESSSQQRLNGVYKIIGIDHSGTISGGVSGRCKTTVTLMLGNASLSSSFNRISEE